MPPPLWPIATLPFSVERWRRARVTLDGGVALDGTPNPIVTDGGGAWRADLTLPLLGPSMLKTYQALLELMDGGAAPIIIPRRDARLRAADGTRPTAVLSADAALRATTLAITLSAAVPLAGGESFGITHATLGRRLYTVRTVESQTGTAATITIRPPLRAAETALAARTLDFAEPSCVMRLADPERAAASVNLKRSATVDLQMVEAFGQGVA